MGTLDGGYQTLVDALGQAIAEQGGVVHRNTPVRAIVSSAGRAEGVLSTRGFERHDHVISTLLPSATAPLLGRDLAAAVGPDRCRYLGIVCLVMRLRRSLSPWYTLNITDRRVPLTAVVETTHVVDPERVGGHLVYAPKYVNPDSPELERSTHDVKEAYMGHIRTMFPGFSLRTTCSPARSPAPAWPSPSTRSAGRAACPTCSPRRAWRWLRRRTSTQRS